MVREKNQEDEPDRGSSLEVYILLINNTCLLSNTHFILKEHPMSAEPKAWRSVSKTDLPKKKFIAFPLTNFTNIICGFKINKHYNANYTLLDWFLNFYYLSK